MTFADAFERDLCLIEEHLRKALAEAPHPALKRLWDAMAYSLFSPGKRFRPLLTVLTARALGRDPETVMYLAVAVECVHTYSLIHDDLPCMDDDDFRRGRPTNHKVFGEAEALLAGDALLTYAFEILSRAPGENTAAVMCLLAVAAGPSGMVGGQVLDIVSTEPNLELLTEIHRRKTGALIRVSVEGAARLLGAGDELTKTLRAFGEELGFAFQLADDIEDFDPSRPEKISIVSLLGLDETRAELKAAGERAFAALSSLPRAESLKRMVTMNEARVSGSLPEPGHSP